MEYILTTVLAALVGYIPSYTNQKGKNYANKEDFDNLKKQLLETTELVESVKVTVSDKSWVNQQVWLKKQEAYEYFFEQLLHVQRFVQFQVIEFEDEEYIKYHHPGSISQPYNNEAQTQQWDRDSEELARRQKYNEEHKLFENLEKSSNEALTNAIDSLTIKTIYLDSNVGELLSSFKHEIAKPKEEEDEQEFYDRIYKKMNVTLEKLLSLAHVELKTKTL